MKNGTFYKNLIPHNRKVQFQRLNNVRKSITILKLELKHAKN